MFTITPAITWNIAGELETGVRIFVHKTTGEVRSYMDREYFMDLDDETEAIFQQFLKSESADYVEVERWSTRESFEIMADFAEQLEDEPALKKQLISALNRPKPSRHFKYLIDNSGQPREQWFAFKNARQQDHVKEQLELLLEVKRLKSARGSDRES